MKSVCSWFLLLFSLWKTFCWSPRGEKDLFWSKREEMYENQNEKYSIMASPKGQFSTNNSASARSYFFSCKFPDEKEVVYFFGGQGAMNYDSCKPSGCQVFQFCCSYLNDLWAYNTTSKMYAWLFGRIMYDIRDPAGNYDNVSIPLYPGARVWGHLNCVVNEKGEKEIILIGGEGRDGNGAVGLLSDTWSFSLENYNWTYLSFHWNRFINHLPNISPKYFWNSTFGGVMAASQFPIEEKSQQIFSFGGYNIGKISSYISVNHVFIYDALNNSLDFRWGTFEGDAGGTSYTYYDESNIIRGRYGCSAWMVSSSEFYVFGGTNIDGEPEVLSDMWLFDFILGHWRFITSGQSVLGVGEFGRPESYSMAPRSYFASVYDERKLFVHGGLGLFGSVTFTNLLVFNFDDETWYYLFGSDNVNVVYSGAYCASREYDVNNYISSTNGHVLEIFHHENGNFELFSFFGKTFDTMGVKYYVNYIYSIAPVFHCNNTMEYEDDICLNWGKCIGFDECDCEDVRLGNNCEISKCDLYWGNDSRVCSGRGSCFETRCNCPQLFTGDNCEIPICDGVSGNETNVCYQHGQCENDNLCHCEDGWEGTRCSQRNFLYLMLDLWYAFVALFGVLFVIIVVILLIVIISSVVILKNKKVLKKIEGIDDLDIILEEKRLEQDSNMSIAHLKIDKKLFEIDFEKEITLKKIIGKGGGNSVVYLCDWKGQQAAFKQFIGLKGFSQSDFGEFEREVSIMASVSHPNILRWYGAVMSPKRVGFLMEFAKEGDLESFLMKYSQKNSSTYPIDEKFRIVMEISMGMCHLHSLNIIHRDLKLKNVLIMEKTHTAKIMDFGISKAVKEETEVKTRRVGTVGFMSPEVFNGSKYTSKCDVFSFGVLMFILLSERFNNPFGKNISNVSAKVAVDPNFRPDLENLKSVPKLCVELIQKCWSHNADDRPTFEVIVDQLKVVNGENVEKKKKQAVVVENKEGEMKEVRTPKRILDELKCDSTSEIDEVIMKLDYANKEVGVIEKSKRELEEEMKKLEKEMNGLREKEIGLMRWRRKDKEEKEK